VFLCARLLFSGVSLPKEPQPPHHKGGGQNAPHRPGRRPGLDEGEKPQGHAHQYPCQNRYHHPEHNRAFIHPRHFLSPLFPFIISKPAQAVTSFARFIIKDSPPFLRRKSGEGGLFSLQHSVLAKMPQAARYMAAPQARANRGEAQNSAITISSLTGIPA